LIPTLLGLYWLLCRYAHIGLLWLMAASLVMSCFLLRLDRDDSGDIVMAPAGPVLNEIDTQEERRCVAGVVTRTLQLSPDGLDYLIAGSYRPQLLIEVGTPLADRIVYTVIPDGPDRLVDTEGVTIPEQARLQLLDRAAAQQAAVWQLPAGRAVTVNSYGDCKAPSR
jgi:hypothetical protein